MNNKIKRPILWKLILIIGVPLFVVYSAVLIINYNLSKDAALKQMKAYMVELIGRNASQLNGQFTQITDLPRSMSNIIKSIDDISKEDIYTLLEQNIADNAFIFGMAVAFEPYAFDKNKKLFAPYVCKRSDKFSRLDLAGNCNYTNNDWYSIPKLLKKSYWTEPYFDKDGGNILMCTYSYPLIWNEKFYGIATADISLEELHAYMQKMQNLTGYSFILSQHGTYVYHPKENTIMKETIFSKAEKFDIPEMREYGRKMLRGFSGVEPFLDPITLAKQWLVFAPISSCNWTFCGVVPESEILEDVNASVLKQITLMFFGLVIILLIIIWSAYQITNPIRKLAKMAEKLADGDLEVQMQDIKGRDEIHELSVSFNKMVADLKHYINDITNATKAREAVESELRIARHIQESLIPRIFPPFPNRSEFKLWAKNIPAKEVAGDFYDFYFVDDENLAIIIADVSGKGVSASLFMAVTKTLIKAKSNALNEPEKIMQRVNEDLCYENDAAMFVTTFFALLNVKTGVLNYSNAGHNLPYLIKKDGFPEQIKNTGGMALGVFEEAVFSAKEITLKEGDTIFLYTDGINEAMDVDNNEFSYKRMEDILNNIQGKMPKEIIEDTMVEVDEFTLGAEQSDDITLLVLKYFGI
jgi:phosphoserine phosphatase RsbU/P